MSDKTVLVYLKTMPEESGLAAFVNIISDNTDVLGLCINDNVDSIASKYDNVYVFGSYWKSSSSNVTIYSRESDEYKDILEFIYFKILGNKVNTMPIVKSFIARHKTFLELTVSKYNGDEDARHMPCFVGLYQIADNMYDAYTMVFTESVTLEECENIGKNAMITNRKIAERRALNNSVVFKDSCGYTVAVTSGTELFGDTHDALLRHFQPDITVITSTVHDSKTASTRVSLRSNNSKYDVSKFASKMGGGGSQSIAGFHVTIDSTYYDTVIPKKKDVENQ